MPDFLQHQRGKARREPDRNTQPEMPAFAAYGGAMQGENRRKRSVSVAGTALLLGLATASAAADMLPTHAGRLDAGSHRQHTVQTAAGDYVHGRISGNGMLLTLQDEQGRPVRVLAKGRRDQEEFMFVAGSNGPYRLDVKASAAGNYRLDILQRIEREAQTPPADMPESPRLQALLQAGGDTEAFWRDIQRDGAPLIESSGVLPALGQHERLVTFLWRGTGLSRRDTADDGAKHHAGMPSPAAEADQPPAQLAATRSVRLFGSPSADHDALQPLAGTDVWYRSYRLPDSTRLAYRLAPDVPELDAPAAVRRRAILATAQRDPFNSKSMSAKPLDIHDGDSLLELPAAPVAQWNTPQNGVPAGSLETRRFTSQALGNSRTIHLYRPAGWQATATGNALLVLFDGESYTDDVPAPTILDNLIAAGRLPPTAAIFITNPSNQTRNRELPPNDNLARFLAEELMPWAKAQGIHAAASHTVIAGASYGGLAATWAGFTHPQLFGNVYSQSGSFWWAPDSDTDDSYSRPAEWLTQRFANSPRLPLRLHLEAGLFELGYNGQSGIRDTTRHLRDVLTAKGYTVSHREYAAAHGFEHWRTSFAEGLLTLLGCRQAAPPCRLANN